MKVEDRRRLIFEFGLNPVQELNGHWLAFEYTSKTGEYCLQFGFNVGRADTGVSVSGRSGRASGHRGLP